MKKIIIIFTVLAFSLKAFTQKKFEKYFSKISADISLGKDYSGASAAKFDVTGHGVIGPIAWSAGRSQPFKKGNASYENVTSGMVGFGQIKPLANSSLLVWGLGPRISLSPDNGSTPKTTTILWGGEGWINISNEELFEIDGDLYYVVHPHNNQYDWNTDLAGLSLEGIKFIAKGFGAGLKYKIGRLHNAERQVPGQQFNAYDGRENRSSINVFVCYKKAQFTFKIGPEFERTKYTYTDNTQPTPSSNANNYLTHLNAGVTIRLTNN